MAFEVITSVKVFRYVPRELRTGNCLTTMQDGCSQSLSFCESVVPFWGSEIQFCSLFGTAMQQTSFEHSLTSEIAVWLYLVFKYAVSTLPTFKLRQHNIHTRMDESQKEGNRSLPHLDKYPPSNQQAKSVLGVSPITVGQLGETQQG